MERAMSVEERIRRAEERYERKKMIEDGYRFEKKEDKFQKEKEKKDIKLLKKMIIQIVICTCIYLIIYTIQNNKYVFSEDFINNIKSIISYEINFQELYNNCKNYIVNIIPKEENQGNSQENDLNSEENNETNNQVNANEQDNNQENNANNETINGIGGAETSEISNEENKENLSQEEQDIENVKKTTSFIKPVEGVISSPYGIRETATGTVPKNHTGTDIAAVTGTKIKSATEGQVVLVSEQGDYGKHIKIQIGEVSIIYAHCNALYVNEGDKISQGQEIAEVGSTRELNRTSFTF